MFNYLLSFIFLAAVFLNFQTALTQGLETTDMCFACHDILDGKLKAPVDLYRSDIHFSKGISCAQCHGGNSKEEDPQKSMDRAAGFIGVPKGSAVSRICSKCHGEQYKSLTSSVHGSVITNCTSCHGIHNITSVKAPNSKVVGANIVNICSGCHNNASFMKRYNPGLRIDQFEKYKTSVHGQKLLQGDRKVATCASCHGSHDIKRANDPMSKVFKTNIPNTCNTCHGDASYMKVYKIATNQFDHYKKSVHGVALLDKGDKNAPSCNGCHGDHGASPPGVESISQVCGTCHVLNQQMFEESPHKNAFASKGIHDCASCHNNHEILHPTDDMLGASEGSVCIRCHTTNDKGEQLAVLMKHMIDSLERDVELANHFINKAEQKGMDVSDAKFDYNDIKKVLIQSRTVVHLSNKDKYIETINEGFKITSNAKTTGEEAVEDYYFRRKGLGVSTILITIVAIAIYLKLRKIEKKKKMGNNQ